VRTGHPVTKEHIETLRKKYPKLRPLVQMDDEKVAQMLNLIANNTANPYKEKNKTFA
jgi:signal transduction histidine kinase